MYLHTTPACTLIWMESKDMLYALSCILKKRGIIKSRCAFYKLFKNPGDSVQVQWSGEKFALLAYLLYILHERNIFITTGTRGYFAFAERHFCDFSENKLKEDCLKNLCYRVRREDVRFALVRAEVNEIVKAISKS